HPAAGARPASARGRHQRGAAAAAALLVRCAEMRARAGGAAPLSQRMGRAPQGLPRAAAARLVVARGGCLPLSRDGAARADGGADAETALRRPGDRVTNEFTAETQRRKKISPSSPSLRLCGSMAGDLPAAPMPERDASAASNFTGGAHCCREKFLIGCETAGPLCRRG